MAIVTMVRTTPRRVGIWVRFPLATQKFGALAQLARASALQAEGNRFETDMLHSNGYIVKGL